jgi:hypothetical protein
METLIACALAHVVAPGGELPDGSVVRSTASAVAPPGSGTSVAVGPVSGMMIVAMPPARTKQRPASRRRA